MAFRRASQLRSTPATVPDEARGIRLILYEIAHRSATQFNNEPLP